VKLRTKEWDAKNSRFNTTEFGDFALVEVEDDHGNVIQVDTPNDPERPGLVVFSPHGELIASAKADGTGGFTLTIEKPDGAEAAPRPELVGARVLQMPTGKGTVDLEPGPDSPVQAKPVHIPGKWTPEQMREVVKDQKFPCPRCGEVAVEVVVDEESGNPTAKCGECGAELQATMVSADDVQGAVEQFQAARRQETEREDGDE